MRRRLGLLLPLALVLLYGSGCSVSLSGSRPEATSAAPTKSRTLLLTERQLTSALLTPNDLGNFQIGKDLDGPRLGLGCLGDVFIDDAQPRRAEVTLVGRSMFQLPDISHGVASLPTRAEAEALMTSFRSRVARCTKLPFGPHNPMRVRFSDDTVRTDLNADVEDEVNVAATVSSRVDLTRGFYQGENLHIPLTIRLIAARIGNQVIVTVTAAVENQRRAGLMATMVMNAAISRIRPILRGEPPPTPAPLDLHVTVAEDALKYLR